MSSAPLSFEPGFLFNPQVPRPAPSLLSMPLSGHELAIRNEFVWRVRALNFVSNCALVMLTALLADDIIPISQLSNIGVPIMDDAIKHYVLPILGISLTAWSLHQLRKETYELPALNRGVGLLFPPIALTLSLSFLSAQVMPTTSMLLASIALYLTWKIYRQLKTNYLARYWKDSILLHTPFAFLFSYLLNDLFFRMWMLSLRFHPSSSTSSRPILPLRTLSADFYLVLVLTTAGQLTLAWRFRDPILSLMAAMMMYRLSWVYGSSSPTPPPPAEGGGPDGAVDPRMDIGTGALPMATAAFITFTFVVAVPAVCMRKRVRDGETMTGPEGDEGRRRGGDVRDDSAVVSVNSQPGFVDATPAYSEFDPHNTVIPPAPAESIQPTPSSSRSSTSPASPNSAHAVVNAGPSTVASSAVASPRPSRDPSSHPQDSPTHTVVTMSSEPPSPSQSFPVLHPTDTRARAPSVTSRSRSTSDAPSLASVESVEDQQGAADERALVSRRSDGGNGDSVGVRNRSR